MKQKQEKLQALREQFNGAVGQFVSCDFFSFPESVSFVRFFGMICREIRVKALFAYVKIRRCNQMFFRSSLSD